MRDNTDVQKRVKLDPDRRVVLPDEIWMKIMGHVKPMYLFQNISLVCKHFYNIHRSAAVCFEVNNVKDEDHFQGLMKVLPDCISLEVIKIKLESSKMAYMDAIIKQVLISSKKVKILKLFSDQSVFKDNDNPHLSMKNIGTLGTKLEHVEFNNVEIDDKNFLSNLHELKTVTIPSYHESLEGPKEILGLLKFWPKFEAINFVDHYHCMRNFQGSDCMSETTSDTLLDRVLSKRAHKLKEASLRYTLLESFLSNLSTCHDIEKFVAYNARLTEEGFKNILELPSLKSVVLHGIESRDRLREFYDDSGALRKFFTNMSGKSLKCLVLSNCKGFDVAAFEELSKQHFPELEALYISQDLIIESPQEMIKKIVANCPKLNHIHLKGEFGNISNEFLLDMFKDFNVRITIEANLLNSGEEYISKKKFFEDYLKKNDSQLYIKYQEIEEQSKWLAM